MKSHFSINNCHSYSLFPSDPMRITKKFAGSSCIGKQVCVTGDGVIDETRRKQIQDELKSLEEIFMAKVEYLHKLSHRPSIPMISRVPHEGERHMLQHTGHPPHITGYPTIYYPCHIQPPPMLSNHHMASKILSSTNLESHRPTNRPLSKEEYPYTHVRQHLNRGVVHGESPGFDVSNFTQNPQLLLQRSQHHNSAPKVAPNAPSYRPRQAHTSADLFGRQYPTTIEQMTFLSSENLRKKLAADNTMPSNGFHTGGRMGMGDAAKFCSAAAHAYSERIQDDGAQIKTKIETQSKSTVSFNSSSSVASFTSESSDEKKEVTKQVDLDASDLLLNFFNAAGAKTTSKGKDGSTCGSSASGSTSNQGEQDGDDSVSVYSDVNDADVSASLSGRSSSLSSERSDGNSDVDYSSPDDNDCNPNIQSKTFYPAGIKKENSFHPASKSYEDNFASKKQRIN